MSNLDKKFDNLIFREKTTYAHSYQVPKQRSLVPINYGVIHEKQRKPRPDYVPLKELQAMTPWRYPNIPFDTFHRPDAIIRRDPRKMQERYVELQNEDREKVQMSRPKVVMKPMAIDLDAFKEPERKMIIDNIYLTTGSIAQRAAVAGANFKYVKAPLPNSYSKPRAIFLEPITKSYVSPEWRMDTVAWDAKQLRAHGDPTK